MIRMMMDGGISFKNKMMMMEYEEEKTKGKCRRWRRYVGKKRALLKEGRRKMVMR